MSRPKFAAFVRLRPDAVEEVVRTDAVERRDPGAQADLPRSRFSDQPWVEPSEAEMNALLEEVVALAREPLPPEGD